MSYVFKKVKLNKSNPYLDQIINISSDAFLISKKEYYDNLPKNKDLEFLILLDGEEVLALCKVDENLRTDKKVAIGNVATKKELRGKGLGTLLMKEVMRTYDKIILNAVQERALQFYLKLGMVVTNFKTKSELGEEAKDQDYEIEGKWILEWSKKNMRKKTLFLLGEMHNNQDNVIYIREYIKKLRLLNPIVLCEIYNEDYKYYRNDLGLRCLPLEDKSVVEKLSKLPLNISFLKRECDMMIKNITKALYNSNYVCVVVGDTHLREKVIPELGDTHIRNFVNRLSNVNSVFIRPERSLRETD